MDNIKIMINFNNTYDKLPPIFYSKAKPSTLENPQLIEFNAEFAKSSLGFSLDSLDKEELAKFFSGQITPEGASSIAIAYAGHQFGHFSPQLGDGRALLMGEILTPNKIRFDLQLKGSGPTPYSRNGDGKSSLGPVIREYILSEAMHSLGVPTTRALAAVATGESVYRETALPGGIFTRVAASHIRVGTFEFFASRHEHENLKILIHYAIDRHYPEISNSDNIYLAFLERVAENQASMVSKWMAKGFIHGVMNTDNMSISGETIDYGPCAFMDQYESNKVYSSIDRQGRYAYSNQIPIAKWNLYRFASCLVPFVDPNNQEASGKLLETAVEELSKKYEPKWLDEMGKKLGIFNAKTEDKELINDWLKALEENNLDFTNSHRDLSNENSNPALTSIRDRITKRQSTQAQDQAQIRDLMDSSNPVYIPRNHQVEKAIQLSLRGDYSLFKKLNLILNAPYNENIEYEEFKHPPKKSEEVTATFCGT